MSSKTWREAIAEENARLGIPPPAPPAPKPPPPKPPVGHVERMAELEAMLPPDPRRRHRVDEMNGLEKKYAAYLETRRMCGEIRAWKFEKVKLKLARATFYSPDFSIVLNDGRVELHETKGHVEDDWSVKLKLAAEMFPEFRIVVVKLKHGQWKFTNYKHQEVAE